ncbi:hypothetical protein [Mailhella sp.]|uniref:hypothetical protein n=1 Tax=Mailhella sp. TaxID=1981029 RepID=UPI004063D09B
MPPYEQMTIKGRGGQLPSYQSQAKPYIPGSGVSARFDDSAGEIFAKASETERKAWATLGLTVTESIKTGVKAYEDYQKAKVTQAFTEFQDRMNRDLYEEGGILTRQGEDAAKSPQDFEAAATRHVNEIQKDMELSNYAFESLKETVKGYKTDTLPTVLKYSTTQTHKALIGRDEALAEQYKNSAMLGRDDKAIYIADIARGSRAIADAKRRAGATDEEIAVAQADYVSGAYYDMAVADLALGKTAKAESFLKQKGIFTGEHAAKLAEKVQDTRLANMKLMIQRDEYETKRADRLLKKAGQVVEKNLTDAFFKGELELSQVQEMRDFLSADDYQKWAERASTGFIAATKDDPATYITLTTKQAGNEDTRDDAERAYIGGKITKSTYDALTSGATEAENKQIYSYLSNALKPSELNANPAAGENYANARRDLDQYLRRNPDATYQEKDEAVRGIAKRYSLINTDKMTLALPMPTLFQGSRADINGATLAVAKRRTVAAFKAGLISQEQLEEESERIQNLTSAWNRLNAGNTQQDKDR